MNGGTFETLTVELHKIPFQLRHCDVFMCISHSAWHYCQVWWSNSSMSRSNCIADWFRMKTPKISKFSWLNYKISPSNITYREIPPNITIFIDYTAWNTVFLIKIKSHVHMPLSAAPLPTNPHPHAHLCSIEVSVEQFLGVCWCLGGGGGWPPVNSYLPIE